MKKDISPAFKTLAITEPDKRTERSRVSIPSERAVKEAKDWVDHNEK